MSKPQTRVRLTAGRVEVFACPTGKSQAFLWDTEAPTLALRATPTGRKTYVFESRLNGATLRLNIGTLAATLEQARTKAKALAVLVDSGFDPRQVERQKQADKAAQANEATARAIAAERDAVTVGDVWAAYLKERRPHWGALHYRDHIDKAKAGGEPSKRRGASKDTLTRPGPLAALMPLQLRDLNQAAIERWAATEGKARPSSARLAWRLLTVFLSWCSEQEQYTAILPAKNPAKSKKAREALGKPGVKSDVLTREQLSAWFTQVRQISNPGIAAALQTMLLTGARPGEVMALSWEDLNTQWKGINIRDKVEGTREIPLTPYVFNLLVPYLAATNGCSQAPMPWT
jgi:integrase